MIARYIAVLPLDQSDQPGLRLRVETTESDGILTICEEIVLPECIEDPRARRREVLERIMLGPDEVTWLYNRLREALDLE